MLVAFTFSTYLRYRRRDSSQFVTSCSSRLYHVAELGIQFAQKTGG